MRNPNRHLQIAQWKRAIATNLDPTKPSVRGQPLFVGAYYERVLGSPLYAGSEDGTCKVCGFREHAPWCRTLQLLRAEPEKAPEPAKPPPAFKPGDRVRCVRNDGAARKHLVIGAVYEVKGTHLGEKDDVYVDLNGNNGGGWEPSRFVLVEAAQPACRFARAAGLPAGWEQGVHRTLCRVDRRAGVWQFADSWTAGGPAGLNSYSATLFPGRGTVSNPANLFATAREAADHCDRALAEQDARDK